MILCIILLRIKIGMNSGNNIECINIAFIVVVIRIHLNIYTNKNHGMTYNLFY